MRNERLASSELGLHAPGARPIAEPGEHLRRDQATLSVNLSAVSPSVRPHYHYSMARRNVQRIFHSPAIQTQADSRPELASPVARSSENGLAPGEKAGSLPGTHPGLGFSFPCQMLVSRAEGGEAGE